MLQERQAGQGEDHTTGKKGVAAQKGQTHTVSFGSDSSGGQAFCACRKIENSSDWDLIPNLLYMCFLWTLTVSMEISSLRAISLLEQPLSINRPTSSSRAVSCAPLSCCTEASSCVRQSTCPAVFGWATASWTSYGRRWRSSARTQGWIKESRAICSALKGVVEPSDRHRVRSPSSWQLNWISSATTFRRK